jgi:ubiquinone/menaquinone biosynthesis C-methylase UbiE
LTIDYLSHFFMQLNKLSANTGFFGLGSLVGVQVALRVACAKQPRPMPHQMAGALDHPLRMRYRDPGATLADYGIAPDMTILDLGCGTGTFTLELARMVGEGGRIHAVDLQQPLVDRTRQRLAAAGLQDRVHLHCCGAEVLPLSAESVDLAVMIATLPQIPDRFAALSEVQRVLKVGGRLVISEELPDPAYVFPHLARQWAEEAGFRFVTQHGTFFCYSILLEKTNSRAD